MHFLRTIEETVPVPLIVMTNSEKPDSTPIPFEDSESKEIENQIDTIIKILIKTGHTTKKAVEMVPPYGRISELPGINQKNCRILWC